MTSHCSALLRWDGAVLHSGKVTIRRFPSRTNLALLSKASEGRPSSQAKTISRETSHGNRLMQMLCPHYRVLDGVTQPRHATCSPGWMCHCHKDCSRTVSARHGHQSDAGYNISQSLHPFVVGIYIKSSEQDCPAQLNCILVVPMVAVVL